MTELFYGACLYPEVWDLATVKKDVAHMKKLQMNEIRFGEFMWSKLEPQENNFQFADLRHYLDVFAEEKMNVILCIPTPTPPRWLTFNHPERLAQTLDGQIFHHGSRQHICTNNTYFQERALLLTEKIAEVARAYDNIISIQIDNEFKAHTDLCGCANCQKLWVQWLTEKYGTIKALNEAWQTAIWSEEYGSFAEVVQPLTTPFLHNTSLTNAYREFTEDGVTAFCGKIAQTLRKTLPHVPLTHNSGMGFNLNNVDLFAELDVAGFDTYASAENYPGFTINLDIFRNLKKNRRFMLLETSTSHGGHIESYGKPHPVGYLPAEAFLTYASGSELFNYWHFRGHSHGCEQPHSAVISSWGDPGYAYGEVEKVGELFATLKNKLATSTLVRPAVALVYSDRGRRYFNTESGGKNNPKYRGALTEFYANLQNVGVMVDCLPEEADFTPYKVVFIPFLHYVSAELLEKIQQFVRSGGTCILGPATGDRTQEHAWQTENGLGELGQFLDLTNVVTEKLTDTGVLGEWQEERFALSGYSVLFNATEALGKTSGGLAAGRDFIAQKEVGAGRCVYLGALPETYGTTPFWQKFVQHYTQKYLPFEIEPGIVYYTRQNSAGETEQWLCNLAPHPVNISAPNLELTYSSVEHPSSDCLQSYEYRIMQVK